MKLCILLLLIIGTHAQADWTSDFLANIGRLTHNINNNMQQIQQGIEVNVLDQLARGHRLNREVTESSGKISDEVDNGGEGTSRVVMSGHTPDGEPYVREIEEYTVGNTLHHYEKEFNPKTKEGRRFRYTLALDVPGAQPVIVLNESYTQSKK